MKALVTGAAGFVGSSVVRELIVKGFEVRALVRVGGDKRNLDGLDVEIVEGDIRDFGAMASMVAGCQYVFHLAALYSQSDSDANGMYEVNVEGTRNILTAAREANVERFVHTSTIGTIGRTSDGTLPNENTSFNLTETSSYVRTKHLSEQAASVAGQEGLPVTIVHPCAPVGPRDAKPTVTGQRIVDFLNGRMPSYVSGGINFVDVEDVATGNVLAATKGKAGKRYILGSRNLSLEDFLSLMELATGQRAPSVAGKSYLSGLRKRMRAAPTVSPIYGGPQSLTCDCSWSIRELEMPQTPLELAIEKAARWFLNHGYVDKHWRRRWIS